MHQAGGRPKLRMSASLLGEGTIAMARAVRETIRARYPGMQLSDAQAQQVLTSGREGPISAAPGLPGAARTDRDDEPSSQKP